MLYNGRAQLAAPAKVDQQWILTVLVPAIAIFALYHYVLEVAMHGRTPGKHLAGVRIVTREGGTPSVGALLARNVFRLIDSFPLFYSVGLATAMLNRRHVRVGDLAAGTLLVHDRVPSLPPPHAAGGLEDAALRVLMLELLERWGELLPAARRHLAHTVLGRAGVSPASDAPADDASVRAALEQVARAGAR